MKMNMEKFERAFLKLLVAGWVLFALLAIIIKPMVGLVVFGLLLVVLSVMFFVLKIEGEL